ncbi:DUF11 domain-containing protein [Actinokineospora iranica]|uniref:Component of the Tol biopolymer transport system n=1 Tax=Actinokineospora iranica TaxID=1271860 RepID=A0A1G6XD30_9PSEU|nr:DUF11 domain-containing protein [Actinokineospora iranica]SDD75267.1 component of the Tol biopolymer transport system [Actinokineospora iranica]
MAHKARTRYLAAAAVAALCAGTTVVWGVTARTRAAAQEAPSPAGRIAFTGTGHRSLGAVLEPVPDRPRPTDPLLGPGPAHYDDQVSARGDLAVFVSLRDDTRPQVYLRAADGAVRRLTTDRDAGHPQLSPDLRTVVFDSAEPGFVGTQRDLWLVGVDGTGLRRLTDSAADETWPTFSPDGRTIAFAGNRGGDWEIYRRPVTGGPVVQVTREPGGDAREPAWNPVDDRIAYTLYPFPRAAASQVRVIDGVGAGTPLLGGNQAGWGSRWPAWKPDGEALLFLSRDQDCSCTADPNVEKVYKAHTAPGIPITNIPELLLAEDRQVGSPTWLEDARGEHLVVSRTSAADGITATLQDMRPDGADPRDLGLAVLREDPLAGEQPNLLFHPRPGFDPWNQRQSYSPDGRRIAVSRFEDVDGRRVQRIWLVDADGADPSPLPVADRQPTDWEFDAAWSPDGRFIAFARRSPGGVRPDGGPSRVVVVEVATGAVTAELRPPPEAAGEEDTQPSWSPDGGTIAFTRGRVFDGPNGEVRDNHVWTARAGTLDQQRDLSAQVCGFDCAVTDDSSAFSPDSRSLVFNRENDGVLLVSLADLGCRVLLPAAASSCATPLNAPTGPFQPRDATFSPDGSQLVLTTRRAGDARSPEALAVLDVATGALTPLDWGLPGRQKEPTWQQSVDLAVTAPPEAQVVDVGDGVPVTVTVTNRGPAPSPAAELVLAVPNEIRLADLRSDGGRCAVAEVRCVFDVLAPGASIEVTANLVGVAPGRPRVGFTVAGPVLDPLPSDNAAGTVIPVGSSEPAPPPPPPRAGPGVSVVAQPNPSYVGGQSTVTYTVRNGSGGLATGLRLDFGLPASVPVAAVPPGCTVAGCALADLPSGGTQVVRVVLAPIAPGESIVAATLRTTGTDADPADNTASTPFRVLLPRIVAVPPIGEPGFVTSVRGLDFPPGAPVGLTWSPGITAPAAPAVPRPDGGFAAQLLILGKDQPGRRVITAAGPGFGPVTTPFLVVPGTIGPPDWVRRR